MFSTILTADPAVYRSGPEERKIMADDMPPESSSARNSGYFGPAHQDSAIAQNGRELQAFLAQFKHALLFTPKLVLSDHMIFTTNFQAAYKTDDQFKLLLDRELVDLAQVPSGMWLELTMA
jgi:hypothetical protein